MQLGMIGIGHMGRPMAHNLLEAGYQLRAHDINPEASAKLVKLDERTSIVSKVADTLEPGGIVLSMVPDDDALLDIALRRDGILSRLGNGIHVSLSTVSPVLAQRLAPIYQKQGASFLSATVVGRPNVAAEARLTVFLSGEQQAKEQIFPVLHVLGKVFDLGDIISAANVAKLATNSLILSAIAAMGEAAGLIEDWGGDPALVLEIIAESPLFANGAVYREYGRMIACQDFNDALFPLGMGIKDARLIVAAATAKRREMPSTRHAYRALLAALEAGRDAEDWSVLSQYSSPRLEVAS